MLMTLGSFKLLKFLIIGLIGGMSALLAKRGVAVFHDGLRPIIPEYIEKKIDKKSLMATSFALSFGLVIGFGIPASISASTVASILLIHSVLLGTDIIGTWSPNSKLGGIIAFVGGFIYGILLLSGLGFIVDLFAKMPVNFLPHLGLISTPIISAFAVFPALVVAYQYGFKKGIIVLIIALACKQIIVKIGTITVFNINIVLNADGMALMISMAIMLVLAGLDKTHKKAPSSNGMSMLVGLFSDRVKRIKKNLLSLSITGGLISLATSFGMLAGDLISLNLLKDGIRIEAGLTALAVAIGFIPLVATTAITTGVYSPSGMKFVFVIGIFITNPIIAFFAGAAVIILEILLLGRFAILLEKLPGIKECSDHIRAATTKVLEVALLVGGMIAAEKIAPKLGFFFVAGLYLINKTSKKPLVEMALGPVAAILLGIIMNILYIFNLI